MRKKITTVNVMGTIYTVYSDTKESDNRLEKYDGYVAPERKIIILDAANSKVHQQHVLNHELVHAFLYESGLDVETWASNEEIVDWIAIQTSKLFKLHKDAWDAVGNKMYPKTKVVVENPADKKEN